jgi:MerR family transcriptional regulator, light-induced transcriptional regulator
MNGIRTNAAAVMLGVSPNTLRSWERRYGFPRPRRTPGGHRQYALGEIESLRATLAETHNVSSAIALARQRGEGPSSGSRLAAAFASFDEEKANGLLEESLALRSVERTVEEVLLEGVTAHSERAATSSTPEYEFGWRYATAWISALKRLSPPATRTAGVLVLDASIPLELDALYAQALELMLRRAGIRTLSLSTGITPTRLARALPALDPRAVVLAGRGISLDALGRLVYSVRSVVQSVQIFDFRGAVPDTGASTVRRLGETPLTARDLLLARLEDVQPRRASTPAGMLPALTAR